MIVVIGQPYLRGADMTALAGGLAAGVARAAAAAGASVEFIGKIGDDPAGDELQLSLARSGVGHVAMLRDPARATDARAAAGDATSTGADDSRDDPADDPAEDPTEPPASAGPELEAADVDLALRYLTEYRVIVVAYPRTPDVTAAAAAAASWAGAHLVVVLAPDESPPIDLPADTVVMAMTPADGEELGALVGAYAAAVDGGADPATAFAAIRTLAAADPRT